MHLKNPLLFGLMAILLLGGTITPVLSQSTPDAQILINEVELNPAGSDAGIGVGGSGISSKTSYGLSGSQEYVELYNTSSQEIDIGGWSLVPSASWKTYDIPKNTIIEPKSFLAITHVNFWFNDLGDFITLVDNNGNTIDETPLLKDKADDANSWQRTVDGLDTNSISDWKFERMTPKSSNGQLTETQETIFSMTGDTDKTNYIFGENVNISGKISEILYNDEQNQLSEIIKINVQGPNYFKNLALFPERNLEYDTSLSLQKVLGFTSGDYTVKIVYGENTITTNFSINDEIISSSSEQVVEFLELNTDKESYIPGDTVVLRADTNSSIEFGGLEYTVMNPDGETIHSGTIFPNERFSSSGSNSGGDELYPFSTQMLMQTVNPVYGVYVINGTFKSQDPRSTSSIEISTSTTFELIEDVKENTMISLSTDKNTYSIGDIVKVSGRSNEIWTENLDLTVSQSSIYYRTTTTSSDNAGAALSPFKLSDQVYLDGSGRFSFEFKVVEDTTKTTENLMRYGDYRVTVSDYFGSASVVFKIVEDPENVVDNRTPLGLKTDNSEYVLNSKVTISGTILNYNPTQTSNIRDYVQLQFYDPSGKSLTYNHHQQKTGYTNCNVNDCAKYDTPLMFTALPDDVGNFEIALVLTPIQFDYGVYTVTATDYITKQTESVQFTVKSAMDDIMPVEDSREPITVKLCKSDSPRTDEILKDLKPATADDEPSMETIDCTNDNQFKVGEKIVVIGTVIPKSTTTLDNSSVMTSGQTEQGHSYTTNYAQSIMNYVDVSIPYPKSMIFTKSAAWKTVPDEGENYHGGGGSGGGGVMSGGEDGKGTTFRHEGIESERFTGYDGKKILQKQKLLLTDMNFKAYPDDDGKYFGVFELRPGVFSSGTYVLQANYFGYQTEQLVTVIDNSLKGGLEPSISLNIPKTEFTPGETVEIKGLIENVYYYDMVSVMIETPDVSKINCLIGHQCGFGNSEKKIIVTETVEGPAFFWNYKIPSENSTGMYKIIADTHFGTEEKQFFVVNKNDIISENTESTDISQSTKKLIEKVNRISEKEIPISLSEKTSEDSTLVPRVIQGSLFTSARGEESDVNLRITTSDGQCIIGQDSDCLVSESTRKPGAIYSVVSIDDVNYKIRYSGNDVRLEKFSIVPEKSNSQIDIDNWNVEVMKDEQPSRFYYKVSYIALE